MRSVLPDPVALWNASTRRSSRAYSGIASISRSIIRARFRSLRSASVSSKYRRR